VPKFDYQSQFSTSKTIQIFLIFFSKMMPNWHLSLKLHHWGHSINIVCSSFYWYTPARTHSISGLKSRVLKLTFLALKMMVKSGLEFILKCTEPLQRYLLTCQANSVLMGRFFDTGQQQLWRGSVNFKTKNSRPLFTIILRQKCKFQDSRFYSTYRMSPS
jgi:hypothetical protein